MAPKTRTAPKPIARQRFLPSKSNDVPLFDPESSDSDAKMQVAEKEQGEPDWESFGEEDRDEESEAESEDDEMEIVSEKEKEVRPKDSEEEELERLVFGDSAGFREDIASFSLGPSAVVGHSSDVPDDEEENLENVADQDLFFFDSGPVSAPTTSLAVAKAEDDEDDGDGPAWEDSDDERLAVSLASVPQLRKLRETEEDDMVNGKEYVRRLRRQYQRLYPTPEWATHATDKSKRKRRRTMEGGESEESASDMDMGEDDLSTQPLARLLKDADILSKSSRNPAKRRKLQPGTLDIQRLKDVSNAGPVCIAL